MGYLDKEGLSYLWEKVKAALSQKQNIITGTQGQVVGFDADGNAVAQAVPASGITQSEADARYLKLSGGTMTGTISGASMTLDWTKPILVLDVTGTITEGSRWPGFGGMIDTYTGTPMLKITTVSPNVSGGSVSAEAAQTIIRGVKNPEGYYDAANKGYVDSRLPAGVIVMWSGATVPDGWALCDGTNGTPDLRGRFVLGQSAAHALGSTGGSEEVALTVEQMPSHSHSYSYPSIMRSFQDTSGPYSAYVSTKGNTTGSAGSSQPHPNMPPYYTLAYIMKL